ncbi:hypothetical protein BDY21DRAFT_19030 [Lineolata rhizophorae]|uniref:Uncharacterized protein n=1 Tax=Lineolata rhizophorae TaxID=578093 RepID=A0A6A6P1N0_9PEZI|nr:hypothetical protein BDY21DRAFT_19030 [Lineolata rhizophorae]
MNRFLTKRKAKEAEAPPSHPPPPPSGGMFGRKWKKVQPEPSKPELDLSGALPNEDNFRTSLLMPNLSARFSMLREQDDPLSKLGKASDDSVLQPKRQSRLADFGYDAGGLSDIAEVSSINSSIRPPFANNRQDSFGSAGTDGYGTDDDSSHGGSIMSRARPGEGNILFGGRQKVYKIPVGGNGSSRSLASGSSGKAMGRAMYEDDVNLSTFQKLKREEKERERRLEQERLADEEETIADNDHGSPAKELSHSSSVSDYSKKRETSSSTNSGPSNTRLSTAATSIASQGANSVPSSSPATSTNPNPISPGIERSMTKARRLYEQGLDQQLHEQQSSAMNRLNSIQRQRTLNTKVGAPYQVKSATNLHDRFKESSPAASARSQVYATGTSGQSASQSSTSSPLHSVSQSPPLSPLPSDSDESNILSNAIAPGDRGKATAMGAFNKPKAFDEQQYLQRQMAMQQGRETPPLKKDMPAGSVKAVRDEIERKGAETAETANRNRSRSRSASRKPPAAFSVFRNAAAQLRTNQDSPTAESTPGQKTFFASGTDSDEDNSETPQPPKPARLFGDRRIPMPPPGSPPPMSEHPALRALDNRVDSSMNDAATHLELPIGVQAGVRKGSVETIAKPEHDSPTLGPDNGGLSGLIHQHLRQRSNVSSVYDDDNYGQESRDGTYSARPMISDTNTTRGNSQYSHSNPWDLEDFDGPGYGETDSPVSPLESDQGKHQNNFTSPSETERPKREAITQNVLADTAWEQELARQHSRDGSSTTQADREAFAQELDQRRKAIQESLRTKVESESRSGSPSPGKAGTLKPFAMLRTKSSRDSISRTPEPPIQGMQDLPPSKAIKMLGLGAPGANNSSPSLPIAGPAEKFYESEHWRSEEIIPPPKSSSRPPHGRTPLRNDIGARRPSETQSRPSNDSYGRENHSHKGRSPPDSSHNSIRNRSSSDLSSSRSRSRPRGYKDDLEKAMVEGTGSSAISYAELSAQTAHLNAASGASTPEIIPERMGMAQSRLRSNSKAAGSPGYFDSHSLRPINTNGPAPSPRLSPAVVSPAIMSPGHSPGLPTSPRPSPSMPSPATFSRPSPITPFSANTTPPISSSNTPVSSTFQPQTHPSQPPQNHSRIPTARKKSINKHDISEPTLISSTSNVDTIELPPGASLKNGIDEQPPPVPPINPRRRRFGFGRTENYDNSSPQVPTTVLESTFSDDDDKQARARSRLRKSSSEGRSLSSKARHQAVMSPNPPLPPQGFPDHMRPVNGGSPPRRPMAEGAMF